MAEGFVVPSILHPKGFSCPPACSLEESGLC